MHRDDTPAALPFEVLFSSALGVGHHVPGDTGDSMARIPALMLSRNIVRSRAG